MGTFVCRSHCSEVHKQNRLAHQPAVLQVNDWSKKNKLTLIVKKNQEHGSCRTQKCEKRPVNHFLVAPPPIRIRRCETC